MSITVRFHHEGHDIHHEGHDIHHEGHDIHHEGHDIHHEGHDLFSGELDSQLMEMFLQSIRDIPALLPSGRHLPLEERTIIALDRLIERFDQEEDEIESNSHPVTQTTLASLEVRRVPDKTDRCCSICQTDYCPGDQEILLPCGHTFHPDCIKPWFASHDTCPTCRTQVHLAMNPKQATLIRNRFLRHYIKLHRKYRRAMLLVDSSATTIQAIARSWSTRHRLRQLAGMGLCPSQLTSYQEPYECISCGSQANLPTDNISFSSVSPQRHLESYLGLDWTGYYQRSTVD